jgi:hypothetical protein
MPAEYRNQVVTGDARLLAERIPDESVDLILTDPVYDRIEDYRWLAEMASRVLKPDSPCLVWYGHSTFAGIFAAMVPPLAYAWQMYWQRHGHMAPGRPGLCVITPCLWLEKGHSRTYRVIADWASSVNGGLAARQHDWGKPASVLAKWVSAFSSSGAIVLDPFAGGGTVPAVCKMLGRSYIAFEIDPTTAERARERVANTQPPLPGLECEEQMPLEAPGC